MINVYDKLIALRDREDIKLLRLSWKNSVLLITLRYMPRLLIFAVRVNPPHFLITSSKNLSIILTALNDQRLPQKRESLLRISYCVMYSWLIGKGEYNV